MKATEAASYHDPTFARNWSQARANGVARGAYHFFRPQVPVDDQVRNYVDTVGPLLVGDLPPMLDLEYLDADHQSEWLDLTQAERAQRVLEWLHKVECELGVTPIVYTSTSFAHDVVGTQYFDEFKHYPIVIAHWTSATTTSVPAPWSNWTIWQYTSDAHLDAVQSARLDLDRVNGGMATLNALKFNGQKVACRA